MKSFFESITSFFTKHRQISSFILCLCVSLFLWFFITYGKDYQHTISYTVKFVDSSNRVEYRTQDTVLTVGIRTNGFEFLARLNAKRKQNIVIDIDKLDINLSKGKATVQTSRLKTQIMQSAGLRGMDISISPATVDLTWNKIYSKQVTVVNRGVFKFKKPYAQYAEPELLADKVTIEGPEDELRKTDTVYTCSTVFNNIDRNCIFLLPLDLSSLGSGVTCRLKNIPVKVLTEKYTENVISIPVKVVRYEDYRNIKVLPANVKVRYRIAIKDFNKINQKDITAYVLCSNQAMENHSKLKINLNNVPDYIDVVNIYPEKAEYILYK